MTVTVKRNSKADKAPKRGRPVTGVRKTYGVSLTESAHKALAAAQDNLSSKLGFRPTAAQAIEYLVKCNG